MKKIWKLNLITLSLKQVIKQGNEKEAIYFEANNWKEADKIATGLVKKHCEVVK